MGFKQYSLIADPFTLKALHRATMPFEYVHRAESRRPRIVRACMHITILVNVEFSGFDQPFALWIQLIFYGKVHA